MLNENKSYKGYMLFITTMLLLFGLITSVFRSYNDGTLDEHFLLKHMPEQTAQIQETLDNTSIMRLLNGELSVLDEALDRIEQPRNHYK